MHNSRPPRPFNPDRIASRLAAVVCAAVVLLLLCSCQVEARKAVAAVEARQAQVVEIAQERRDRAAAGTLGPRFEQWAWAQVEMSASEALTALGPVTPADWYEIGAEKPAVALPAPRWPVPELGQASALDDEAKAKLAADLETLRLELAAEKAKREAAAKRMADDVAKENAGSGIDWWELAGLGATAAGLPVAALLIERAKRIAASGALRAVVAGVQEFRESAPENVVKDLDGMLKESTDESHKKQIKRIKAGA